jgi:hypothetical protein
MHRDSSGHRSGADLSLERAIALTLIGDDGARRWSREELAAQMGVDEPSLEVALARLVHDGVLLADGRELSASRATVRLDELGLICV